MWDKMWRKSKSSNCRKCLHCTPYTERKCRFLTSDSTIVCILLYIQFSVTVIKVHEIKFKFFLWNSTWRDCSMLDCLVKWQDFDKFCIHHFIRVFFFFVFPPLSKFLMLASIQIAASYVSYIPMKTLKNAREASKNYLCKCEQFKCLRQNMQNAIYLTRGWLHFLPLFSFVFMLNWLLSACLEQGGISLFVKNVESFRNCVILLYGTCGEMSSSYCTFSFYDVDEHVL